MRSGAFKKAVILAEGHFSPLGSKTANCVIRFQPERVAAVIDSRNQGRTAFDVLGFGPRIPIVSGVDAAMTFNPDSLLIGIAPPGGGFDPRWRALVLDAIQQGLDVASGLHDFLADDPEFKAAAEKHHVVLWDLRRTPDHIPLNFELSDAARPFVVLVAGTDCDVGKMTTSFLLADALKKDGIRAEVAPSGQTGIFLAGRGIPLDRVISDFVTGASQLLIRETLVETGPEIVFFEGQGTLLHPVYSAVAMGILYGARPDAVILCHEPDRENYIHFSNPIPGIRDVIRIHEELLGFLHSSRVIAVSLCSPGRRRDEISQTALAMERDLGLPVADPVAQGTKRLTDAVAAAYRCRMAKEPSAASD